MPRQTKFWRIVFETSMMSNNDEYAFCSEQQLDYETFHENIAPRLKASPFSMPRLVICRPIFEEELEAGLVLNFKPRSCFDEDKPDITITLDGLYKFINNVQKRYESFNERSRNPTSVVESIIAQHYYDCMSGGMPISMLVACRMAIKQFKCNLSVPVYPGKDNKPGEEGWYTLKDFMDETERYAEEEGRMLPYFEQQKLLNSNNGEQE
jgi:hypothetical protein